MDRHRWLQRRWHDSSRGCDELAWEGRNGRIVQERLRVRRPQFLLMWRLMKALFVAM
jgi:hypothetical protein